MQFDSIIGLEDIKHTLIRAVQQQHVAHAQLFLGKEGSANLAMAWAYSKYLNCEAPTDTDSCGKCPSCYRINKLIHPDLHFVFPTANVKPPSQKGKGKNDDDDATSGKRYISDDFLTEWRNYLGQNCYGSLNDWAKSFGLADNKQCNIPVDEGRKIINKLMLSSFDGKYKILIIWLPELMNLSAANSILKILEEPPEKTIFLLVSNSIEQMLPTILSRTQVVAIRQFADEEVEQFLRKKYPTIDENQLAETILIADGNLAEATRMIEKGQSTQQNFLERWLRACYKVTAEFSAIQTLAEEFAEQNKEDQKNLFQYTLSIFRQGLVIKFGSENLVRLPEETLKFVRNFAKAAIHENNIQDLNLLLSEAITHLERNASPKIMFVDMSLKMYALFKKT
jgi:DNA polymerase-3 subunit delta'